MTMNQYEPFYFRKKTEEIQNFLLRPGSMIDIEDCFQFLGMKQVPDRDHQSSLDYLKGV